MKQFLSLFVLVASLSFGAESKEIVVSDVIQVTKGNYEETVSRSKLPLVIDVNATWCNPCRMMSPIIDELSEEYDGRVQFAKIDFDSQSELVRQYDVTSLPTLIFIKPGQKKAVMKNVGFISKEDLKVKIKEFLKK